MRVIGGALKSRRLVFPKTKLTRPMTDRAKETIFNILGDTVRGAEVLDLFAGSGSLGIEALSRGASRATFVEKGPWGKNCLCENLKRLGLKNRTRVFLLDAQRALGRLEREGQTYSLIFLDPPYNQGLVKKILIQLDRSGILMRPTQVIVHHSRQERLPEGLEKLKALRERKIGQACLSFLSRRDSEEIECAEKPGKN